MMVGHVPTIILVACSGVTAFRQFFTIMFAGSWLEL